MNQAMLSMLGTYQTLEIVRAVEFGIYLNPDNGGDTILLPIKEEPDEWKLGDKIEVFIYLDSEDRVIATRRKPLIQVGQFALLKVSDLDPERGAFMDWGLEKDLLVPFREQGDRMEEGRSYLVYALVDERSGRIIGSSRLNRFLSEEVSQYQAGDQVEVIITREMEIGYRVIVDQTYHGMLYKTETFQPIQIGDTVAAYVKKVRPDGRIDLSLRALGYQKISKEAESLLQLMRKNGGVLPFGDKSDPAVIKESLGMSKKTFKTAISSLYRDKQITLAPTEIRLV